MNRFIVIISAIILMAIPSVSQAGTLGCLLGAAGGGFGGAQFGGGNGKLAMTAIGTLLGCGVGSRIQDSNQQNSQRRQQYFSTNQQYTGYITPQNQYQPYQPPYRQPYQLPQPVYQPQYSQPYQPPYVAQNRYCREYQAPITVGRQVVEGYGQACSYDGGQTWNLGPLTPVR